ncbi:MAG: hypothetical protein A3F84_08980 [Candidatus Handelsmanbacteria bacterium RIFCSPLOWO2_12_FULL_64_10]|uniref:Polymerase nucleotidyl transferase domain-containing protein n=1 Tax=Handelsmanbacteria sp. (strain RIFCSPLOWO2_12_FULL_64_10) TaxID=1817868 RepID=A0A1F6C7D0_HANXR|nr:MAG: hypothetical protein A3F84_08980 [Candidatus Handelsmanbacteria bacterium RIFCSPLOWO2_12_FULL_64_10]
MVSQTEVMDMVRVFVDDLVRKHGDVLHLVVLFGSRAKGTALPWSDVDILIVMEQRDHKIIDEIYAASTDIFLEHLLDFSFKIYSRERYEKGMALGTPFMKEVQKTGIVLWKRT